MKESYFTRIFSIGLVTGLILSIQLQPARGQSPDGKWSDFVNISNTPTSSTYPCITADTAGNIHVLWSEDVGGRTKDLVFNEDGTPVLDAHGNQLNHLTEDGNTLFYTRWDGKNWVGPIDIQFNPIGRIEYPSAVVDKSGVLHVVWVASEGANAKLLYSRAPADKAESAREWSHPVELASPILFAYYPLDISIDTFGGLHILFSKIGPGPGAYVINSFDNGNTWSAPIQIYTTFDERGEQEGVSPVMLISDNKDRLHATWTRYDVGGNGRAIFYSQSRDQGRTWAEPFEVATWQTGWYEVDWLSVGFVGDEIHLVWEGSSRVATQVERISHDGGLTWSESSYILPNLVGENGYADLVTDSADQLHLLVGKRGDSHTLSQGIWYTTWEKDHWEDPILLGTTDSSLYSTANQLDQQNLENLLRGTFTGAGLRYQVATIVNGNELHVVVVREGDGEIWESHTTLPAPYISPKPYPQPTKSPTPLPLPVAQIRQMPTTPPPIAPQEPIPKNDQNQGYLIMLGALPAFIIIIGLIVYSQIFKRK